jgi:hypothetical protein
MTSTFALLHDPVKFIGCVMASYLEQKFALKHSILHSVTCEKKISKELKVSKSRKTHEQNTRKNYPEGS